MQQLGEVEEQPGLGVALAEIYREAGQDVERPLGQGPIYKTNVQLNHKEIALQGKACQ